MTYFHSLAKVRAKFGLTSAQVLAKFGLLRAYSPGSTSGPIFLKVSGKFGQSLGHVQASSVKVRANVFVQSPGKFGQS